MMTGSNARYPIWSFHLGRYDDAIGGPLPGDLRLPGKGGKAGVLCCGEDSGGSASRTGCWVALCLRVIAGSLYAERGPFLLGQGKAGEFEDRDRAGYLSEKREVSAC